MTSPELKPVYFISGSDRPKVMRAVERLRSRFDADASERLSAVETTGDEAVAACNALGLFGGGRKLVLVEEVERWKAADVKVVVEYLGLPAPDTVLALVGTEIKKDSPLAKTAAKAGEALVYNVVKKNVTNWLSEQFARAGAKADADACKALIELVGDDLVDLATETEKLATWADGDEIHEADVERLVAARAETPPFIITDSWGRRDVAAVLAAYETTAELGSARSRSVPALVGRLYAHVGRVRDCKALDEEGVLPRDAASRLKMHPFVVEKAFAQARNFSRDELEDAVVRLADLDRATKGGSRLPDELELQRTLVDITRRQGPGRATARER